MVLLAVEPSRGDLYLTRFATRHLLKPIALLLTEASAYGLCVWTAVASHDLAVKLLFAFFAGVLTATLGIIGHDCGHRGGTRFHWLNRLIGTVGFLPALHPLSRWEHHHNRVHHRYTAQLGLDNAFPPMTVEEYRAASPLRRFYYRFLRSIPGHALFYLVEIWGPSIIAPRLKDYHARDWFDFTLVVVWTAALLCGVTILSHQTGSGSWSASFLNGAVYGLLIPFLIWNLFISFVTVVQHTGPDVRWSVPNGRPSSAEQKMRGTVRICFPEAVDILFHRLMQHPAHHLNPIIPLYSLKKAQHELEEIRGDDLLIVRWTLAYHWRLARTCKLYDPVRDGWCDFNFRPTA